MSKAAETVSLSQSAASYLLAQFRERTGDPLFTRSRHGMLPTPFAERFYDQIKPALEAVDRAVSSIYAFDALESDRVFRIAMSDIGEMVFVPKLVRATHPIAPNILIESRQIPTADLERVLRTGQIDFAIGHLPELMNLLPNTLLFTEKYVCLYSATNSHLQQGFTVEGYMACSHVEVVSSLSIHNRIMRTHIANRRIGLRVPHYASVPATIANSDMVVAVPSRIAGDFSSRHNLVSADFPFETPGIEVRVYWCKIFEIDPGHAWMRQQITAALQGL